MALTLESLTVLLNDACSKHLGAFKGEHEHTTHGKRQVKDLAMVIEAFRKSVEDGLQQVTKRNSSSNNTKMPDTDDTGMQEMESVNHALASEVEALDERADKLAALVKEKRDTVPAWIEEQMNAGVRALGDVAGEATIINAKDADGGDVQSTGVVQVDGTRMQTLCKQFVEIGSRLDTLAQVLPKTARDLSDARDTAEKLLHQDKATEQQPAVTATAQHRLSNNKSENVALTSSTSITNDAENKQMNTDAAASVKRNGKTVLAKRLARKLAAQTTKRQCVGEVQSETSSA